MEKISFTPRQAALWFAGQGHPTVPLNSITDSGQCTCGKADCPSPGKHPLAELAPNGAKNATAGADTVAAWFDEHYWLNFGIVCDKLFVVDVDVKGNGLETWRSIYSQPTRHLPHTWTVRTGSGGRHVFFQGLEGTNIRNGKLDVGIDLRTRGAYIVGPGCRHASGGLYVWDHQCAPGEAPLAEVPAWLKSLVESRTHCGNVIPISAWRRIAREHVVDGARHGTLLKLIGHLAAHGNDEEVTRELLLSWNRDRCEPPLTDTEVMAMVANIYERENNKNNWFQSKLTLAGAPNA